MNELIAVQFREAILKAQAEMAEMIARGDLRDVSDECKLTHYFVPKDEKYGCVVYGRQIFLPAGSVVVGKIHRHSHLNVVMQGKVSVNSEFGKQYFEAPCIFVSQPGLKRAVYAETDVTWLTVHLTEHTGEENLDKIEEEVISPDYKTLGLLDSTKSTIDEQTET